MAMFDHNNEFLQILNRNSSVAWIPVEDNTFMSTIKDETIYIEFSSPFDVSIYGYSDSICRNTVSKKFHNYTKNFAINNNNPTKLIRNVLQWLDVVC
jgi:hypothetical protein